MTDIYLNYDGVFRGPNKDSVESLIENLNNTVVLPFNGISINYILHCFLPYRNEIEALFEKYPAPEDMGFNKLGRKMKVINHGSYSSISMNNNGSVMEYSDFLLSRVISSSKVLLLDFLQAIFEDVCFLRGVKYLA